MFDYYDTFGERVVKLIGLFLLFGASMGCLYVLGAPQKATIVYPAVIGKAALGPDCCELKTEKGDVHVSYPTYSKYRIGDRLAVQTYKDAFGNPTKYFTAIE